MYCWAYPKPQKTEALTRNWHNEIILAQHIPYQHSIPIFDQEHQHILQECNNMGQIFSNIHFSLYWFVLCLKANGGVEKEVLESYCWMYSTWNIPRVSQKYHRKYSWKYLENIMDVLDKEYSVSEPKYHRKYFWKYLENITDALHKEYSEGEPKYHRNYWWKYSGKYHGWTRHWIYIRGTKYQMWIAKPYRIPHTYILGSEVADTNIKYHA